ncbi:MAG: hypothetical protein JSR59_10995 [Proteobacteria bacterium]|nr:hypothetical protein [Pseudomonadota bacterium]
MNKTLEPIARLRLLRVGAVAVALCAVTGYGHADPVMETVQHSFTGADGDYPSFGTPTLGQGGNLYGVTEQGGAYQLGAIYRLAPDGTETLLYSFQGNGDGFHPAWTLARDAAGNLYGTAQQDSTGTSHGTIFRITPSGIFTTLHAFAPSGAEGWLQDNAITIGNDGLLYGVAFEGGTNGAGTFFRMRTDGSQFTVLFNFGAGPVTDQVLVYPQAGIVQGADGNFYGLATGFVQQNFYNGNGAVYRITPAGVMTPLYIFTDPSMEPPIGMPRLDAGGNLYFYGDVRNSTMTGRIYKLDTANALSTLHHFATQEGVPTYSGQLLLGKDGRLYGTTYWGGPNGTWASGPGTVFSLGLDGQFAVLHDFGSIADDGANSQSGLVTAADGSLWGTTRIGGTTASGTVYRLAKPAERFLIQPSTISVGQTATLRWSSTNTTSCAASGSWGPTQEAVSGSMKVAPTGPGTYTYTLACSGAGTVTRSATLVVKS